jgi:hypothetical protein
MLQCQMVVAVALVGHKFNRVFLRRQTADNAVLRMA